MLEKSLWRKRFLHGLIPQILKFIGRLTSMLAIFKETVSKRIRVGSERQQRAAMVETDSPGNSGWQCTTPRVGTKASAWNRRKITTCVQILPPEYVKGNFFTGQPKSAEDQRTTRKQQGLSDVDRPAPRLLDNKQKTATNAAIILQKHE